MPSVVPDVKKTILLVEDELLIAMMESRDLETGGYNVIHAACGQQAVDLVREQGSSINLVLMDIDLGRGMDGTEAARQILDMREIPVIFLSSHTENEIVNKTEEITSYGYVVKNTGATVLAASIRMAFRLFEANRKISLKNNEIMQASTKLMELNDELLRSRNSIAESEERYKYIYESFVDVYYRIDASNIITEVSPSVEDLSGWKPEEILGRPVDEIYANPADREIFLSRIAQEGRVNGFEALFRKKDGSVLPMSIHARMIFDRDGRPAGIEGSLRDISGKKHTEEMLHKTIEQYRILIDNSVDMIWTLDAVGRLTYVSPAWEKVLGYSVEYTAGRDFRMFIHPDDAAWCSELILEGIRTGERIKSPPFRVLNSDGAYRWHEASGIAVFDRDGRFHSCVGVSRDIHERKIDGDLLAAAKNAADSASMAKSEFIAKMSHAIRTPLSGVIGFTRLLCTDDLEGEQKRYAENACVSAMSLLDLVDDLLDFSKIEAGMMEINPAGTDIPRRDNSCSNTAQAEAVPAGAMMDTRPIPVLYGKFRILMAEDNEINLELGKAFLKRIVPGAEIIAARDGAETLDAWKEKGADIIFMDIQMPVMDGYEVTSSIRKIEKDTSRHTPVIALTAGVVKGDRDKCLESGMDGYMVKPVDFRILADMLEKYLVPRAGGCDFPERESASGGRFSIDELRRRLGGDEKLLGNMLNITCRHFGGYIRDLVEAAAVNDHKKTARHLHLIKGAALNACFNRLAGLVCEFENLLPCDNGKMRMLAHGIEVEYEYIRTEIYASGLVSDDLQVP